MNLLKLSLFLFLGVVVSIFLWGFWSFVGYDIVRDMRCGPSSSISKPMAEAIGRELNKRGTPEKIVKLETLKNLPYELVECNNKPITFKNLEENNFKLSQTCYLKANNQKYLLGLVQSHIQSNGISIRIHGNSLNQIFISKMGINEVDLTKSIYDVSRWKMDGDESVYLDYWRLWRERKNYSKQSKGTCVYKSPLKF